MNSINEYKNLKKTRWSIKCNLSSCKSDERRKARNDKLNKIEERISELMQDSLVKDYLKLSKIANKLKTSITVQKRHNKDTSTSEKQLADMQERLQKMEFGNTIPTIIQKPETITPKTTISYYIISLAWTGDENDAVSKTVTSFVDMSNHINKSSTDCNERHEYIRTWKYFFESIEDKVAAKTILTCASHMIDAMKTIAQSNAEVFGRIQNY